jgi:hypothetical protein
LLAVGEFSSSSIDWWAGPPLQKRDETFLAEDLALCDRTAIDLMCENFDLDRTWDNFKNKLPK